MGEFESSVDQLHATWKMPETKRSILRRIVEYVPGTQAHEEMLEREKKIGPLLERYAALQEGFAALNANKDIIIAEKREELEAIQGSFDIVTHKLRELGLSQAEIARRVQALPEQRRDYKALESRAFEEDWEREKAERERKEGEKPGDSDVAA